MSCPRCGSNQAYLFVAWKAKTGELYNIETGELIMAADLADHATPVKSYRTVECRKCGKMFRLTDEQYEALRW